MRLRSLGQEDPLKEERQPTPAFLPGESHGQRSLAGYSPWAAKSWTQLRNKGRGVNSKSQAKPERRQESSATLGLS